MSSPDRARRRTLGLIAAAGLALALGGCLRPLYGPTASRERMQDLLASIEVAEPTTAVLQERLGHYLRSELIFLLDGSGQPKAKRYRLTLNLTEGVQSPIVDTVTGRTESATVVGRATYTLYAPDGRVVTTGTATGSATFDRTPQRFAAVRAAREADIRLATLLAEQIKTRIAAVLLSAS
jgi:LPS-assembly lipoprotein